MLSDKTGTLTQNVMVYQKCSLNGHKYDDAVPDPRLVRILGNIIEQCDEGLTLVVVVVVLSHCVVVIVVVVVFVDL